MSEYCSVCEPEPNSAQLEDNNEGEKRFQELIARQLAAEKLTEEEQEEFVLLCKAQDAKKDKAAAERMTSDEKRIRDLQVKLTDTGLSKEERNELEKLRSNVKITPDQLRSLKEEYDALLREKDKNLDLPFEKGERLVEIVKLLSNAKEKNN